MSLLTHHSQDRPGGPVWVEAGKRFEFEDLVFFAGKGEVDFTEAAGSIDLIITGPHATGALPREVEPFLVGGMTERIQFDFSDHTTSALGRRWAASDPRVLYIEFPHHRTMYDPNRPPPSDVGAELKEFWRLREAEQAGEKVSYNGVDAVRPVSFGGVEFLREPDTADEWESLVKLLADVSRQGAEPYGAIKKQVVEAIVDAKCRRLSSLNPEETTRSEWASATHLHVMCLHDTMNTTIRPNGAVDVERPLGERLPEIVSMGNRGDSHGEPRPPENGQKLTPRDVVTMPGHAIRSLQNALQDSFGVRRDELKASLALNEPYLGAYEVQDLGRLLRQLEDEAVVRHGSGEAILRVTTGAYQAEFRRELLLGPNNTAEVRQPGEHWPATDVENVGDLVTKLRRAYELLRRWDFEVEPPSRYKAPVHR